MPDQERGPPPSLPSLTNLTLLPPSPLLPPSVPPATNGAIRSHDSAGAGAAVGVLVVLGGLLLILGLDYFCRTYKGLSLYEALRSCCVIEAVALMTVHPNSVEMQSSYDVGKWRPWRDRPDRFS